MPVLSTDAIAPRERFDYWREVITRRFVALRPERVERGTFYGEIEPIELGELAATRVRSVAQRVHRGAREIAASPAALFFLNFQLGGTSSVRQDGPDRVLREGDFAIVDASRPFELGVSGPLEHLSIALPHDRLAPLLPARTAVCGRVVDGARGTAKLVGDLLRSLLASRPLGRETQSIAEAHLVELVGVALREAVGPSPLSRDGFRDARYATALRFIARNASSLELVPQHVAVHLHVSLRYLQVLFAERGDTVGRRILRARLELARRMLSSEAERRRSVTEIALSSGFRDPSHFSRSFLRHFGMSPTEWRRRGSTTPRAAS